MPQFPLVYAYASSPLSPSWSVSYYLRGATSLRHQSVGCIISKGTILHYPGHGTIIELPLRATKHLQVASCKLQVASPISRHTYTCIYLHQLTTLLVSGHIFPKYSILDAWDSPKLIYHFELKYVLWPTKTYSRTTEWSCQWAFEYHFLPQFVLQRWMLFKSTTLLHGIYLCKEWLHIDGASCIFVLQFS